MDDRTIPSPYEDTLVVKPAWLDDNGHMNVAYYLSAFDDGGEVFFRDCGLGWDYTRQGVGSIFIASCDLDFRRELLDGDRLRITTQLVDWAPRFVHTYQALYHRDEGYLAASAEMLFVHVSFADRKSINMPQASQLWLKEIAVLHSKLPTPENLGRKIGIRR